MVMFLTQRRRDGEYAECRKESDEVGHLVTNSIVVNKFMPQNGYFCK